MARKRQKKQVSKRTMQRRRQRAVHEAEKRIEQVCQKMAEIKNNPISDDPELVWFLYRQLGEYNQELARLIGPGNADDFVIRTYGRLVKSK